MQIERAERKAVPMLISLAGVSGSGKTYSALLMAAGMAGAKGRVTLIDTENRRGSMYADSPGIVKALPNGYDIIALDPPFSPERYMEALQLAEKAGSAVTVVDSGTHEYEGIGGVCEIAEKNPLGRMPNWAKAKIAHKKFMNYCLSSSMHIIFCLRARDKVKVFKKGDSMIINSASPGIEPAPTADKDTIVSLGMTAIQEKGFTFEMLVSLLLDEHTHFAIPTKVPEPLISLFPGSRLITKEDGERVRIWNDGGNPLDLFEQIQKRARAAAEEGTPAYTAFFSALTKEQKKHLTSTTHAENKAAAEAADKSSGQGLRELIEKEALRIGPSYLATLGANGFEDIDSLIEGSTPEQATAILEELRTK